MSLPVRGAWIEIGSDVLESVEDTSLPVRGAWIEISSEKPKDLCTICRSL